ncbi:Trp biosynthesis-associated membrane protein [Actinomadura sp. NEAU-AAG7]|uniref:Trp biosynthesis-associated membrane protein n=1 Tax=Actinomadura sp. NEAU-AAG7 TaxID=2839640 RepID=UPI001BE471E6|nr:Trp biosynthesis-associated membrane protein [Actinomadura sp. NEAU-AAG7]MBT2209866.1 Trp biosynthesis-associated membrane protein [Actinomadura sp. NEAU-AAG7]
MTPGRERGLTALLCAAGSGLALLAAGRTWATVHAGDSITPVAHQLSGRDLGGAPGACALAGLAALAALFATSGRVRAAIGALTAAFGAGVVYASTAAVRDSRVLDAAGERSTLVSLDAHPAIDVNLWWMVSVTGGVVLAVGGLLTLVRGARWPGMSSRYDRASGRRAPAPAAAKAAAATGDAGATGEAGEEAGADASALWKSLDRGEDPTARRSGRP